MLTTLSFIVERGQDQTRLVTWRRDRYGRNTRLAMLLAVQRRHSAAS
jgi:hypothetical protein